MLYAFGNPASGVADKGSQKRQVLPNLIPVLREVLAPAEKSAWLPCACAEIAEPGRRGGGCRASGIRRARHRHIRLPETCVKDGRERDRGIDRHGDPMEKNCGELLASGEAWNGYVMRVRTGFRAARALACAHSPRGLAATAGPLERRSARSWSIYGRMAEIGQQGVKGGKRGAMPFLRRTIRQALLRHPSRPACRAARGGSGARWQRRSGSAPAPRGMRR